MASREYFDETPRKISLNSSSFDGMSAQQRDSLRDECARTALALTALFDGEANVEEGLLARTHLAGCAQCDNLWQAWTQQNQMLHSLSAPVPAGLLTRILTAIRLLSAFPQMRARLEAKITHFEPNSGSANDARLLPEVVFAVGANPFAPRRNSRSAPKIEAPRELPPLDPMSPMPPANLHEEILRRTIGAASGKANVVEKIDNPVSTSEVSKTDLEPQRNTRSRRSMRFSATLVPALAAWLIFLSGPSGLWTPLLDSTEKATPKAQATLLEKRPVVSKAPKFLSKSAMPVAYNDDIVSDSVIVEGIENSNSSTPQRAATSETPSAIANPTIVELRGEKTNLPVAPEANIKITAPDSAPRSSKLAGSVQVQPIPTPLVTAPAPKVVVSPKVTPIVQHNPATTAADLDIRTRRAAWSAPVSDEPVTRAASIALTGNHVTAPQPTGTSDGTEPEADAETLEHVNRLNDARPEDVRSVLDDYRASLLAENTDSEVTLP